MKTLVLYYTKSGHTLEAVTPLVDGIRSTGSEAEIVSVEKFNSSMISDYDAFIVGSPCWAGSVSSTGVAAPLVKALKSLPENILKGKLCGGIAVNAQYGGETTLSHIKDLLSMKGCEKFSSGPIAKAGSLMLSLVKGPSVKKADEDLFRAYGIEFAS